MNEERPLIASVFMNRMKNKMLLQCDPTVVYALERANRYRGTLFECRSEVRFALQHLPIRRAASRTDRESRQAFLGSGERSRLRLAYSYFVRTTGGRHTFSETLAAHNRAVAAYRAMTAAKKCRLSERPAFSRYSARLWLSLILCWRESDRIRPLNTDIRIVPGNAAFGFGV